MRQLEPNEVRELLARPASGLQLLDVRLPWEHETARLPGSTLIPMHEIARRVGELDRTKPVIVYCHHGVRSLQVALFLERSGFSDVINLSGGIDAYSLEADPSIPRY